MGVDVLADDDGVVDHHAEHDDEGEHRDHVQRGAEARNDQEPAEERDGNAKGHPERQARLQKQSQAEEHQDQTDAAVLEHEVHAAAVDFGAVGPDSHLEAFRQRACVGGHVLLDCVGHPEDGLVGHAVHRDHRRGSAVETGACVHVLEGVADGRHLAQSQPRAVGARAHHDFGEFLAGIALALGADQDLAGVGLDAAAGQVQRSAAHRRGQLGEGQAVGAQVGLGHLDGDFIRARAYKLGLGDFWIEQQVVAHTLGEFLEGAFAGFAVDHHVDGLLGGLHQADDGLFGLGRKRDDAVDGLLDLIEHFAGVGVGSDLGHHRARSLDSRRVDALDPLDALDRLLDAQAHALLNLFGTGPEVGNAHRDHIQLHLGEDLLADGERRHQAGEQDEDHQQVGGYVVAGEPLDDAVHEEPP